MKQLLATLWTWAWGWNRKEPLLARAFGGVLCRHRESLHLTQEDFAKRAGLSRSEISFLERGKKSPNFKTLLSLARALRIPPDVLLREAREWLDAQPDCCRQCYFSCLSQGVLPWLNANGECVRPSNWRQILATR